MINKLKNILASYGVGGMIKVNCADKLFAFIESNYIPNSDYSATLERSVKAESALSKVQEENEKSETLLEAARQVNESYFNEIHKLKEENEKLKGKAVLNEEGEVLFISVADHKELLRLQRVNCVSELNLNWDAETCSEVEGAVRDAPEPIIEDLHKGKKAIITKG
jgi:hypothetical protein